MECCGRLSHIHPRAMECCGRLPHIHPHTPVSRKVLAAIRFRDYTTGMKKIILRLAELLLGLRLLERIFYAAGGPLKVAYAIENRTYTTREELTAMVLIFCILILLTEIFLAVEFAASAVEEEDRRVSFAVTAVLLFLIYIYACLYGYPLLDNHFTTAWFMTGQYTAQLLESILNLGAGIFRMEFSWNDTAAWYAVSACLLVYPFVLLGTFLGDRNFWPVFIASLLPPVGWISGHWMLWSGPRQMLLGAVTALLSAGFIAFFTDETKLGREKKAGREPLFRFKMDGKKRIAAALLCLAAWGFTFWCGRVRSFGAVMRLVFSSSVYSYQKNLYTLADMRIAQAMLVSYVTSLVVKFVLSFVKFEDSSRLSKITTPAWMLLFQIWVLPLLSNFMSRAAESAQGAVSGEQIGDALQNYGTPGREFLAAMAAGQPLPWIIGGLAVILGAYLVFMFTVRLPFVRLAVWFVVWFAACTYIYCLAGLFYRSAFGNTALLMVCYFLNRFLNALLSAGEKLRGKINAKQ